MANGPRARPALGNPNPPNANTPPSSSQPTFGAAIPPQATPKKRKASNSVALGKTPKGTKRQKDRAATANVTAETAGKGFKAKFEDSLATLEERREQKIASLKATDKFIPVMSDMGVSVVGIKVSTPTIGVVAGYLNLHDSSQLDQVFSVFEKELKDLYELSQVSPSQNSKTNVNCRPAFHFDSEIESLATSSC